MVAGMVKGTCGTGSAGSAGTRGIMGKHGFLKVSIQLNPHVQKGKRAEG